MRIYAVADIHGKPEKIAQRGNGGFWPGWITAGGNAIEYGLTTGGQWFVQRLNQLACWYQCGRVQHCSD